MRRIARLLIGRYGRDAPARAAERAAARLAIKNYGGASLWAAIADIACRMTTTGFRVSPRRSEPSASQVLDGEVTRAVMNADKVDRADLEAVLNDAADKLKPK